MKFTIDVSKFLYASHRLKKDGLFKEFKGHHDKELMDDDFTFDDFFEAKWWMENHDYIDVEGKKIPVNPSSYGLTDPTVSIRPHRTGKPKHAFISENELKTVLLKGDDNYDNSLVIDFDGFLHLVHFNQAKGGPYAVRFETFLAGNGYVGTKSSLNHIEDTYLSLLDAWETHLVNHDKEYRDYPTSKTKEELLEEIKEAINNL
jgi:hypothetical protein